MKNLNPKLMKKMKDIRQLLIDIENACEQRLEMAVDDGDLDFLNEDSEEVIKIASEFVFNMGSEE